MEMVCGVEILAEQRTPLVEALLGVIDQLQPLPVEAYCA